MGGDEGEGLVPSLDAAGEGCGVVGEEGIAVGVFVDELEELGLGGGIQLI